MGDYQKEFKRWAEVAKEIEEKDRPLFVKSGAIYWCYLGVGIGSELVGKGGSFTRPVLVLAKIDKCLAFVVPITTKTKRGGHYIEVVVNGLKENVILYQGGIIDVKRIGDFIDEVSSDSLAMVRRAYLRFVARLFQKRG